VLDFGVSVLLLGLLAPLMLILASLIKLVDGGPILSPQWRVGARGKLFQVYKFRTTVVDNYTLPNSSGIRQQKFPLSKTWLGRWLAHTHLDKLPMLLNVLRGEMSLVGPHPWAIYESVTLPMEYKRRLHILPGITGTWQTFSKGEKHDICLASQQDITILENWSLWQDFRILTGTILDVLFK
jgi:lipopolysaccharide/colanic/teichoic acid biosynthesis glycosyltransferase